MIVALTKVTEIKDRIISEFTNSNSSICVAMAYFTDRDIAMSLIEAKERGINVDIIISSSDKNEIVNLMLKGANVPVQICHSDDNRGSMHHKFCLIDDKISINGSFNFTYMASSKNAEAVTITDDPGVFNTFKDEFDKLKLSIKNDPNNEMIIKSNSQESASNVDAFAKQLQDLVFSSTKISSEDYKNEGYEESKKHLGNIDIYKTACDNIKEKIKVLATNDSLSSTKNLLLSNISGAFESKKSSVEYERDKELNSAIGYNSMLIDQLQKSNNEVLQQKSILETGNPITNENGIIQINQAIEKNKLSKRSFEESIFTTDFWHLGTIIKGILLLILSFYLSIFFSSALYKILFESDAIDIAQKNGLPVLPPKIVDANSIITIFDNEGTLFGMIAVFFFIIPVLFSNLKLIGSKNETFNSISFWVGLVVFDILVSVMVTVNTIEMKANLEGLEAHYGVFDIVTKSEFWLIFVFGMIPLIIVHYLIESIYDAYNNSKKELVDALKYKQIQSLDLEMIDLLYQKETLQAKIYAKEVIMKENSEKLSMLEAEIKFEKDKIQNKFDKLLDQYSTTYEEFRSKIITGKIFTEVIFDSALAAYKSGFIEYLPEHYSVNEVTNRVQIIEQIS